MIVTNIRKVVNLNRFYINTQIIKKYQTDLTKLHKRTDLAKPLTLQQQIQIINSPQIIKHLEIMQYGVKLPKPKKWPAWLLLAFTALLYYHYSILPITIVQRYLCISTETKDYPVGYFGSFFTFSNHNFYVYLPYLLVVNHSTRYIKYYLPLLVPLMIINGYCGSCLVHQDLKNYEVWNRQKISCGEGIFHAIGYALWSFMGLKNGLGQAFKSRIFLNAQPGLGIIVKGIPIGVFVLFFTVYQTTRYLSNDIQGGRAQLILTSTLWGIFYGLILRRFNLKV